MEWHFLSTIFVNSLYSRENMIVCTNKIYILNSMNLINWFFLSTTVQNELIVAVSLFYSLKFSIRQSAYEYKTRIVPCGRFTHALNLNPHNFFRFLCGFFLVNQGYSVFNSGIQWRCFTKRRWHEITVVKYSRDLKTIYQDIFFGESFWNAKELLR